MLSPHGVPSEYPDHNRRHDTKNSSRKKLEEFFNHIQFVRAVKLSLVNANALLTAYHNLELNLTLNERVESVVRSDSDVGAGMDLGASLSYDDAACLNSLTTELLYAETLGFAITAVLGRTNTLLVGEELQT